MQNIKLLKAVLAVSFWIAGLLGIAAGAVGIAAALPTNSHSAPILSLLGGIAGSLGAGAGMIGSAATNRAAKLELEDALSHLRGQAIAFAVAL